jgi:transcriptional regulator with XRE-family HTH domain
VFLDAAGQAMDYAPAVRELRNSFPGSAGEALAAFAAAVAVSPRTVQNWEGGRPPSAQHLAAIGRLLDRRRIRALASELLETCADPAASSALEEIRDLAAD